MPIFPKSNIGMGVQFLDSFQFDIFKLWGKLNC